MSRCAGPPVLTSGICSDRHVLPNIYTFVPVSLSGRFENMWSIPIILTRAVGLADEHRDVLFLVLTAIYSPSAIDRNSGSVHP